MSMLPDTTLFFTRWPGVMKPVSEYGPSGTPASKPAAKDDDSDDDFDPFASDDSEVGIVFAIV